jgi:hypothetical protein
MVAPLQCLRPHIPATTPRRLSRITLALRVMTGRSTLLGLSGWAGTGGSSRTVQRWCATVLPWAMRCWGCWRHQGPGPAEVSCVAGDDVLGTPAGTHPQGLARCCASVDGQPVPGRAGWTRSLVRVQHRRSCPRRRGPAPLLGPRRGEVPGARLAPRGRTTPSRGHPAPRRAWRATSRLAWTRGHGSTRRSRTHGMASSAPRPTCAPPPAPMSGWAAVTGPWWTPHACTMTVYGSQAR